MNSVTQQVLNAFFYYGCISLTLALGIAALVSGLAAHLNGMLAVATLNYFVGFLSLSTAHWVYSKGKKILVCY
ncbi:MAG TPA: hypothetical protein HA252_03530 [Candidatus Diapherotrites archaeon]|uniref:Uncharacterized protein n=1 Tax=Candidatus Iainarchaeum sp. TaxID=3101447 RepID=A0A7J4JIM0_9ARCH|nr:hypothetical protein [Candidatus Diapherotrites archaeon]HIH16449.1 hypothetical protein [Candidatus Diapherotrites archaeon]